MRRRLVPRTFPRLAMLAALAPALWACSPRVTVPADVRALHDELYVFDLHIDSPMVARFMGYDFGEEHKPPQWFMPWRLHVDLPRAERGNLGGGLFGLVVNPASTDPVASVDRQIDYIYKEIVQKYPERITIATSVADFRRARDEGRIAVWLSLEGAHEFGGSLEPMARWHRKGVRSVTLAHFTSNEFAASSADDAPERPGLSPLGRQLICEANRLGWAVDLAHTHPRSFYEALELTQAPVIVSHTGLAEVQPTFRNLTAAQVRAVGRNGGVIGVIFAGFWLDSDDWPGLDVLVDHMDVVRREAGIETLAIGSDFDGFIWTPGGMKDVADLPALTDTLLERGYARGDLQALWGDNVLRVLEEVEAVAAQQQARGVECPVAAPEKS